MIYFFYNTEKEKVHSLIQGLLKRKPDAMYFRFDEDTYDQEFLKGLFESQGLFEEHHIVYLDELYVTGACEDLLPQMKESSNIFVLYERDLLAKDKKNIEQYTEKVVEGEVKKKIEAKKENPFALTDALGKRNKKEMWILYNNLLLSGKAPEELHGLILWQGKSMLLAQKTKTATDAGLKPFVYTKAKQYASHYTPDELMHLSEKLVSIAQKHRSGSEMETMLEEFILSL